MCIWFGHYHEINLVFSSITEFRKEHVNKLFDFDIWFLIIFCFKLIFWHRREIMIVSCKSLSCHDLCAILETTVKITVFGF